MLLFSQMLLLLLLLLLLCYGVVVIFLIFAKRKARSFTTPGNQNSPYKPVAIGSRA